MMVTAVLAFVVRALRVVPGLLAVSFRSCLSLLVWRILSPSR